MRRRGFPALVAITAGATVLAACTGVPSSSSPETVKRLNVNDQPAEQAITPTPGAQPRQIVDEFLAANAAEPGKHVSAAAFLTPAARNRWNDDRVTILSGLSVSTYDPRTTTITVVGNEYGEIDKDGVLKPSLDGDGTGGTRVSFPFKLKVVNGQYRIDQLRPGLLIRDTQFTASYEQHPLYFFDAANQYLIPDLRYTDIVDSQQEAEWLLDRLVGGPREELQNAVSADTLPAQTARTGVQVHLGAPTTVEIPGASQLDNGARNRLAAQLSETLNFAISGGAIRITDGGRRVRVPAAASGDEFSPDDFTSALGPPTPPRDVYYLLNGRIIDEDGKALPGPLGRSGTYVLTSVALSRPTSGGPLLVAGVQGEGSQAQLWVGNRDDGLKPTGVRGALSRPAFAHGRAEVWVGNGPKIERVTVSATGTRPRVDDVAVPEVPDAARIRSVRISPDGSRVAVVVSGPGQTGGQLMIGSIVRGAGEVRVDALESITPQQAVVTDAAWLTPVELFAIGRLTTSSTFRSFDTRVDGSDWRSTVVGLTNRPDHVTVAADASGWLSTDGFVWEQSANGQWISPNGGQTAGTAPVYLE